jgi:hypothetical protein
MHRALSMGLLSMLQRANKNHRPFVFLQYIAPPIHSKGNITKFKPAIHRTPLHEQAADEFHL